MTDRTIQGQGRALCAKGLKKNYGSQQVLRDLDLSIEPGHIYGLIGRNGAGKTTLLSILTGQNTKNGGEVTYGGEPVWENPRALGDLCFARELNPSSEVAALKVEEYLLAAKLFCPRWDAAYADALLKKFGLDTKKRISKLSKGQMSMVTITAALASRAPVTILDEPAAGLDVVMRERFYRLLLDDYAETGRTFVISTHIIEEAAGVFERVIVLDEGASSPTPPPRSWWTGSAMCPAARRRWTKPWQTAPRRCRCRWWAPTRWRPSRGTARCLDGWPPTRT